MLNRLLNFLLNHLLFAGTMFFAAGATIGDVGTGGGTDGGNGEIGTEDAGVGTGDVTPSDDGSVLDESADREAESDSDASPQVDDPNATVDLGDGRQVPAKFKKLFDLAKAQGLDKEVKQLYFANQRLSKAIPNGVNGAIELAKAVEQFGGVEGIQELQTDIETYRANSDLFERDQAKWIETSFADNSEASLKAMGHAIDFAAEHHPEQYNHMMSKVLLNTLDQYSPVGQIWSLLSGLKDNPQAQQAAQELAKWYNGVKNNAQKIPEKKVDAQQKALTDREAAIQTKEMDQRYREVNSQVAPAMKSAITKGVQAEAKLAGVDLKQIATDYPGAFEAMMEKIQQKIMASAVKDQRFVDKHYALVKKGDLKRAIAAVNQKHDAIIPAIVREVAGKSGLLKSKVQKALTSEGGAKPNQNVADAGWTRVNARPQNSSIDWSKTTSSMQLDGKYILSDGKKVQVHY